MNMNNFENPKDIINEGALTQEKIAPKENIKIAQEKFMEIKNDIEKLKTLQNEILAKMDKHFDNLSGNTSDDIDRYPEAASLRDLQVESTSISLKIEDKIKELDPVLREMEKVRDLSQISKLDLN